MKISYTKSNSDYRTVIVQNIQQSELKTLNLFSFFLMMFTQPFGVQGYTVCGEDNG